VRWKERGKRKTKEKWDSDREKAETEISVLTGGREGGGKNKNAGGIKEEEVQKKPGPILRNRDVLPIERGKAPPASEAR